MEERDLAAAGPDPRHLVQELHALRLQRVQYRSRPALRAVVEGEADLAGDLRGRLLGRVLLRPAGADPESDPAVTASATLDEGQAYRCYFSKQGLDAKLAQLLNIWSRASRLSAICSTQLVKPPMNSR